MFPPSPGLYVLLFRLSAPTAITIGRLGSFEFAGGWYAYVGSARGPGGLAARLSRHQRTSKPLHWHIDYLRQYAEPRQAWFLPGDGGEECEWANALTGAQGASVPVPHFGSSDCRCRAHLIHFPVQPDPEVFSDLIGMRVSAVTLPGA